MINNRLAKPMRKIPTERCNIYTPVLGYSYTHHPSIARFKGRFYALFSQGKTNEDDCGQRVMLATSDDFNHWNEPFALVDSMMGRHSRLVLTASGLYTDGETLCAYIGKFEYTKEDLRDNRTLRPEAVNDTGHLDTELGVMYTTDGVNWSPLRWLGLPVVLNHPPQPTQSGRLIAAGGVMFPFTDDKRGLDGFKIAGIYRDAFGSMQPYDDCLGIEIVTKALGWNARLLCEGSFYQTDDGVINMMLRSNSGVLWCARSYDDGETYADPFPTEFTDDGSKFHFGRLPDGRFYSVGNPVVGSGRNPLVISLSEDGENFDTAYILRDEPYEKVYHGMYKNGLYGYPHTLVHDDFMYIIYSKRKEVIEISRVALSDL